MADVKVEVTRVSLSTAAALNTQDITISGFGTPKAAMFIFSEGVTDDTIASGLLLGIGWTDGTREFAISGRSQDAVGTSNTSSVIQTNRVISLCDYAGTAETGGFSFDSWITDGVRLHIDNDMPSAFLCTCILFGGSDITNVYCDIHDNMSITTDITAPGFEPDLVFMSNYIGWTPPKTLPVNLLAFGCGINDGLDTQRVMLFGSMDNFVRGDVYNYIGNDSISGEVTNGGLNWDAVIGSYDANGFSVVPNDDPGSDNLFYLCFKFANSPMLELFDMAWPTSGDYTETGLPYSPNFGLIASVLGPASRNVPAGTGEKSSITLSAFDATGIYSTSVTEDDDADPTVTKSVSNDELKLLDSPGASYSTVASGYSLNSDGWTFTLSTNPAAEIFGWGLAIGTGVTEGAMISAPTPLGVPVIVVHKLETIDISAPSPLGAPSSVLLNDFTGGLTGRETYIFVMDLTTPTGTVRVPITSWQGTLQVDRSNYAQCVVYNVDQWAAELTAATAFTVYRSVTVRGLTIESEMVSTPISSAQYYRTAIGHNCVLSGNWPGYTADASPPTEYDRTLVGIRNRQTSPSGVRVRCDMDFMLRPAQRAYADGLPLIVAYINYYALQGDAYMDVGERN